ncbi:MAG: sigma-54 dependent transcriptional regulator [Gammaproteobacteria bacterium]|nr:sigma-54-dependent Fis family transcriptional regulator [Rhodocyclaceae bacterium]MBU3908221.1 sigma-54 dependent transcriptional regulator [Gammaproteobacteria bacterium]MBU3988277.1 sigma-54 dependent transcriptional regulator [Gammaproteobacteria bacterium]MBU4003142.1 sigma-54 dependent transcriptional regulator [Gammaproteobacteria bacterium]MBU4019984.1 sigma-54 dependent transcriptional regulator [Gammaproteobacteria bacterium]
MSASSTTSATADKPVLLIVDDDPLIADTLGYYLGADFQVFAAGNRAKAIEWLQSQAEPPPLALVDLGLPPTPHRPQEGFALISELLARAPAIRIVVLSGQNDAANARHARAMGAVEFIAKPAAPERLRELLLHLLDIGAAQAIATGPSMLGESLAMQKLRAQLRQYADSPFPVLIEGESGSGKELAAAALHDLSPRRNQPYLALNCAAIAPTLVEPALFGHAKGAFTGATGLRHGYFEEAGDGTLLLDEIGELPLELQPKLLRVLENGEYQRVGDTQPHQSRARVIAATNRDLKQEVRSGRFRADLYHRLSVFTVTVPPLRELGDDRLRLLDYFRHQLAAQFNQSPFTLTPEAEAHWLAYGFPGNVRELRNIVIRLATRYAGQTVSAAFLAEEFDPGDPGAAPVFGNQPALLTKFSAPDREILIENASRHLSGDTGFSLDATLLRWEDAYIEAARRLANGNISQAARLLGINRTTLYNRLDTLARERVNGSLSNWPADDPMR